MNDEEKRRWLRRYRDAVRAEKMLQEELDELERQARRCSAGVGSTVRAGVGSTVRAGKQLQRAWNELKCQINACGAIRREVVEMINRCEDPVDHEILRRRYLLGEKWLQIAMKLPMDERNVRRRAARAVRKIWPE